jgi:2-keto-4-pentenoate hydratase/2-oxohepta-3-ene-1,7-dioic acid hydratase in catechol pathway
MTLFVIPANIKTKEAGRAIGPSASTARRPAARSAMSPRSAARPAPFVGGKVRQEGDTSDMICNAVGILSIISGSIALQQGDLCFADARESVGAVRRGKTMLADIDKPLSLNGIGG